MISTIAKTLHRAGSFSAPSLLRPTRSIHKDRVMAKPNYSFQKRQKELAKKKKKEEKKQRKLERQNNSEGETLHQEN
jgi:hypothetical protein